MRTGSELVIADAHSDLLQELVFAEQQGEENPFRSRWLEQLQAGEVALQVCAVYESPHSENGLRGVFRQIAAFHTAVESNAEVSAVGSRRDLEPVGSGGLALLLAIEGVSSFGEDLWPLELVARLGVRVLGPTWNEQNAFAHGCDHDGGLTALGRQLIDRVPALGMVVDLAHASPRTVADVLDRVPDGAVFVSHASCRAIYDHRRNLSDAQLTAMAERGGVVCLMPHPLVVDPSRPTVDHFIAAVLTGRTLADVSTNIVQIVVVLGVGLLVGFAFKTSAGDVVAGIVLLLLIGYAFSWVFAFVGLSASSPESANAYGFIILFPLTFVSSAFVPVSSMPGWLQPVAEHNPFTVMVDAIRGLFVGNPVGNDPWIATAWSIGITLVFAALAIWRYRRVVAR